MGIVLRDISNIACGNGIDARSAEAARFDIVLDFNGN
jgi:hypothetical protein